MPENDNRKNHPHYPNAYASGGHKEPLATKTAGRRYRVRDDAPGGKLWGKALSWDEALKLKERVAGTRRSKNVIVEDMEVPYASAAQTAAAAQVSPQAPPAPPPPAPPTVESPPEPIEEGDDAGEIPADVAGELADLGGDADLDDLIETDGPTS